MTKHDLRCHHAVDRISGCCLFCGEKLEPSVVDRLERLERIVVALAAGPNFQTQALLDVEGYLTRSDERLRRR